MTDSCEFCGDYPPPFRCPRCGRREQYNIAFTLMVIALAPRGCRCSGFTWCCGIRSKLCYRCYARTNSGGGPNICAGSHSAVIRFLRSEKNSHACPSTEVPQSQSTFSRSLRCASGVKSPRYASRNVSRSSHPPQSQTNIASTSSLFRCVAHVRRRSCMVRWCQRSSSCASVSRASSIQRRSVRVEAPSLSEEVVTTGQSVG